jgi:hypothetical protein
VDIAISIYKGRIARNGDDTQWFSLMPKECGEYLQSDPFIQIASQIFYTYKRIEEMKKNYKKCIWDVQYVELCQQPNKFLSNLTEKAQTLGINLGKIDYAKVPESFKISSYVSNDDGIGALAEKFKNAFRILEKI